MLFHGHVSVVQESAKRRPLRDVKRFMDRLRLNIHAGRGGSGFPRYGGIGGSGGSVYLKASDKIELRDVVKEYPDKRVNAGHGQNSKLVGKPSVLSTTVMMSEYKLT